MLNTSEEKLTEPSPKKERVRRFFKKAIMLVLNPHFLICFGIAWIITNGWSYIMMALGTFFEIGWMIAVSGAYLTFLWLPISPEKIVTFAIAIFLLKLIFPRDEHTLGVLRELLDKAKSSYKNHKNKKSKKQ